MTPIAATPRLSVNVNKVATLRNSRGGAVPSVLEAVEVCVAAGAPGITVHPRADARHITTADVRADRRGSVAAARPVEYNIEGDPRPDLLDLVDEVRPDQCTLVPVRPGEITSQAGWPPDTPADVLGTIVQRPAGTRHPRQPVRRSGSGCRPLGGVDGRRPRRALHRAVRARVRQRQPMRRQRSFQRYVDAANLAHALGLGVNAGHDLDLDNLMLFRTLPHLDEVSIGHALISRALFVGLDRSVRDYLAALEMREAVLSCLADADNRARSCRADVSPRRSVSPSAPMTA